jgi:diacylglycerol kinase (ATP)
MKTVVLCSPHSGTAVPPEELVARLAQAGVRDVEVVSVHDLGPTPRGRDWAAAGADTVLAAGGDGTLAAAVTQIDDAPLRLGIIARGTVNDTARSLGLPLDLDPAIAVIAAGKTAPIDVGEVIGPDGRRARFLHAAGVGMDGEFARMAADTERREKYGALNYGAAMLQALVTTRARPMRVRFDDGEVTEGPVIQLAALNTPHLFGSVGVDVPDIHPQDGKLTVFLVRSLLKVERLQVRTMVVEAPDPDQVTIDGEPLFATPATIRIAPQRVAVFVP